jgi:hypothetical protein
VVCEHFLVHGEQFEIGSRRHITDSTVDIAEFNNLVFDGLMDNFEHFDARWLILGQVKISIGNESRCNIEQSFSWPVREPVDCAAIDERGELSQSSPEDFSERRHCNDHVDVLFDTRKISLEHVHLVDDEALSCALSLSDLVDWLEVFSLVQAWNIT